jgi:hypothetical protein
MSPPLQTANSQTAPVNMRPPKGQHHHWDASFLKSEIGPKRGLDEADHLHKAHQEIGPVGPDLLVCFMDVISLI